MDNLAPLGEVYQASTFAGNPIVMKAGIVTLNKLRALKKEYKELEKKSNKLTEAIIGLARKNKVDLKIMHYKGIFSFKFSDSEQFRLFYRGMLGKGIYFAPSEHEVNFLSFSHGEKDITETIEAVKKVLASI
jgi:glutamate-1-semialdehyde 2,1-aminomutase